MVGAVTDTLKASGTGSGSIWLTACNGLSLPNWYANAAIGVNFTATQDWNHQGAANRIGDVGSASATFTRQMLTKARLEFILGPVLATTLACATDVRLICFNTQISIRGIAIYSGTVL